MKNRYIVNINVGLLNLIFQDGHLAVDRCDRHSQWFWQPVHSRPCTQ